MKADIIYFSLDEAREEIKKRWNNTELRNKIEDELGKKFISEFRKEPRGVSFRQVCSPDNGFTFFYQCSKYIGTEPLVVEYYEDVFTHINEEKKGLGRLRLASDSVSMAMLDIMDFHEAEGSKLGEIKIKTGEKLVEFHRNLFDVSGFNVDFLENSKWFQNIGKASDYYYFFLLHVVAHGALFEVFFDDDDFTDNIILPAIKKVKEKFGVAPIIIKSYPDNQTEEEDFYWWCYPLNVNKYLLQYARDNNLIIKTINN